MKIHRRLLREAKRNLAFVLGLSATVSWILLLRYCGRLFWTSPIVPWSLVAGSLALTVVRQQIVAEDRARRMVPARVRNRGRL